MPYSSLFLTPRSAAAAAPRFVPPAPPPARSQTEAAAPGRRTLHELDDDRDQQGVDADRFREGEAKDHVGLDRRPRLRVAPQRLHRLRHQVADAERRPDRADADGDTGADVLHA